MIASDPAGARRFYAEEIRVTAAITSAPLIDALATVPRERFLPAGPWQFRGAADVAGPPRITEDADPSRVYHDVSIAIDPSRNLYNGQPSLVARWLDALDLRAGHDVVHIGCGTGYFTALLAHIVGASGAVQAMDVDPELAARAAENLRDYPWVTATHANGVQVPAGSADRILVHAGATHVLDIWLDALRDGGRLMLPLTIEIPGMPGGIGKGVMLLVTRRGSEWQAQTFGSTPVAIYSLRELRDPQSGAGLPAAMMSGALMKVARIRRDPHNLEDTCIVHGDPSCLSAGHG
jgi:protein-L-isoaspartate(D-aspartate) O-methyltransferase